MTKREDWKEFRWFLKEIKGEHSLHKYRQLARAQNTRHSSPHYIEMTLADELENLKIYHD